MNTQQFNNSLKTDHAWIFNEYPKGAELNGHVAHMYLQAIVKELGYEPQEIEHKNWIKKSAENFQLAMPLDKDTAISACFIVVRNGKVKASECDVEMWNINTGKNIKVIHKRNTAA